MRPLGQDDAIAGNRWHPASNASGEDIPPFALVRVTGDDLEGTFEVAKPDTDGGAVWVANYAGIEDDPENLGLVTNDFPAYAYYDTGDGTPAVGETWGAGAGSWKLRKDQPGFRICGDPDTTNAVVRVERENATAAATPTVTSWKHVVRAASTANVTLASGVENGDALDGVTLATGDRILLKNQSTAAENGIYTVNASGAPTRAADADGVDELVNATVQVSEGTVNADTVWMCTTNATITPGTTSTAWLKIYPRQAYGGRYETTGPAAVEQNSVGTDQTSYSNPVALGGGSIPDNTPIAFFEITATAGSYWVFPAGPASNSYPGYVTTGTQTFAGLKTFNGGADSPKWFQVGNGTVGYGTLYAGDATYASLGLPTVDAGHVAAHTPAELPHGKYTHLLLDLVGPNGATGWVQPMRESGAVQSDLWIGPTVITNSGRVVSAGRYAYYKPSDGKVYTGVSGTYLTSEVLGGIVVGGTALTDPGADRLVFWDDSEGAIAYATPSAGLEFSTTTFRLVDQGAVTDPSDMTGGTADTALQAVGDTSASDQSATINDNFADLVSWVASLTAKLRTAGIIS